MGGGGGAGEVTAHRLATHPGLRIKGKEAILGVAGLLLQLIQGDAAPVHPRWRTGFEPTGDKPQALQGFG